MAQGFQLPSFSLKATNWIEGQKGQDEVGYIYLAT